MKKCSKCNEEKELNQFYVNNQNKKSGLSAYCKKCQKTDKKIHYKNNKEQYTKNVFNNSLWLLEIKMELKCERCGFDHPAALDFHHKDPTQKEFGIGGRSTKKNREKTLEEIKKCEVLCSNCHRIEHAKHYNSRLAESG